jgi:hypothetical protein
MRNLSFLIISAMALLLSGCELVGDIFKAGVWSGILIVVAIIALIIFLIGKAGKK